MAKITLDYIPTSEPQPAVGQQPSFLRNLGRQVAQVGARAIESAIGAPGDILQAGLSGLNYITGNRTKTYPEIQSEYPLSLPTSEQVRGATRYFTGEKLEPQSKGEEIASNIAAEIGGFLPNLLVPGAGASRLRKLGGYAARAIAGTAGEEAAEAAGAPESVQNLIKFGALIAPVGGRKDLKKIMNQAYKSAEEVSGSATISSAGLRKSINDFGAKIANRDFPGKEFINDRLRQAQRISKGKDITLQKIWDLKKDYNAFFDTKEIPDKAVPVFKELIGKLNEQLQNYGKKVPEFSQAFNRAEDIFRGLNQASGINKFLQRNASFESYVKNPLIRNVLFGGILYPAKAAKIGVGLLGGVGTAGIATREAVKFAEFLKNSPEAVKYYQGALRSAASNNASSFARYAKKLDTLASKEQKGTITIDYLPSAPIINPQK